MKKYPLRFYIGKKLLNSQLDMVDLIERALTDAGYSRDFVAMGIVNAYAESKFVPTATMKSSKEDSAGLFMLNKKGGLGVDMPTGFQYPQGDSRKDPELNVARIIRAISESPATQKEMAAAYDWPTIMNVWIHRIERPNGKHFEVVSRLNTAAELFPQGIDGLPVDDAGARAWEMSGSIIKPSDVKETETTSPWAGRLIIFCVAGIAVTWYARERAKQGRPLPGFPRLER